MLYERFKQLDEAVFYAEKHDMDEFESGAEIVRLGDWGYMEVDKYESLFESERERNEYQALVNAEASGEIDAFTALVISNASDDELNEILEAQLESAAIYYTEAE